MTPEKIMLYKIKDHISQLSNDDQIRVAVIAGTLRNILATGAPHASIAYALVGAEAAAA